MTRTTKFATASLCTCACSAPTPCRAPRSTLSRVCECSGTPGSNAWRSHHRPHGHAPPLLLFAPIWLLITFAIAFPSGYTTDLPRMVARVKELAAAVQPPPSAPAAPSAAAAATTAGAAASGPAAEKAAEQRGLPCLYLPARERRRGVASGQWARTILPPLPLTFSRTHCTNQREVQ